MTKTKQIMLHVPPDFAERIDKIRQQVAPLTPLSTFCAEMIRRGIELEEQEMLLVQDARKKGEAVREMGA